MPVPHSSDGDLEVLVEGVLDPRLATQIEFAIRTAFVKAQVPGDWVVGVAPADQRGRWDVGLKGRRGRHILTIAATPRDLPELIRHRLDEALDRLRRDGWF